MYRREKLFNLSFFKELMLACSLALLTCPLTAHAIMNWKEERKKYKGLEGRFNNHYLMRSLFCLPFRPLNTPRFSNNSSLLSDEKIWQNVQSME